MSRLSQQWSTNPGLRRSVRFATVVASLLAALGGIVAAMKRATDSQYVPQVEYKSHLLDEQVSHLRESVAVAVKFDLLFQAIHRVDERVAGLDSSDRCRRGQPLQCR